MKRSLLWAVALLALLVIGWALLRHASVNRGYGAGQAVRLEFRTVREFESGTWTHRDEILNGKPTGYEEIDGKNGLPVSTKDLDASIFSKPAAFTGDDFASAETTPFRGGGAIRFVFNDRAKRAFKEYTQASIGKPLAIFLNKRLISAPNISGAIPGEGVIEGRFTLDQARTIARQLSARG